MDHKIKVLIVDDHQIVIDGIKSVLAQQSNIIVCETATTGEEAWAKILAISGRLDLVIVDISMPGISGIELCKKIKEKFCSIKVLFLSMHDEAMYVKQAIACEADGYMLKICDKNELLTALNAVLEKGSYFAYNILPLIHAQVNSEKKSLPTKLTLREIEILDLILKEMTSKEIADKLFISKQTVDTHRINIMEKTSSKSIVGLIKYAISHNLVG